MVALTVHEVTIDLDVEVDVDPDGEAGYCTVAERFSVTAGGFCENCGARDHERH